MRTRTLWALWVCLAPAGLWAAPPEIQFQETGVTAAGVTRSGQVAFFSVAREATGVGSLIVRREEVVTDEDADGIAQLALDKPVPRRSIWVAVDLTTGELSMAAPGGYPLREVPLAPGVVRPGASGKLDRLSAEREIVELFVARPDEGAWALTVYDGSEEDEDGPGNRLVSTSLERLVPVGDSPAPPDSLKPGDVVVVMDPNTMQVSAARLKGGDQ